MQVSCPHCDRQALCDAPQAPHHPFREVVACEHCRKVFWVKWEGGMPVLAGPPTLAATKPQNHRAVHKAYEHIADEKRRIFDGLMQTLKMTEQEQKAVAELFWPPLVFLETTEQAAQSAEVQRLVEQKVDELLGLRCQVCGEPVNVKEEWQSLAIVDRQTIPEKVEQRVGHKACIEKWAEQYKATLHSCQQVTPEGRHYVFHGTLITEDTAAGETVTRIEPAPCDCKPIGSLQLTLPSAPERAGENLYLENRSQGAVTILGTGKTLQPGQCLELVSDSVQWLEEPTLTPLPPDCRTMHYGCYRDPATLVSGTISGTACNLWNGFDASNVTMNPAEVTCTKCLAALNKATDDKKKAMEEYLGRVNAEIDRECVEHADQPIIVEEP